MTTITATPWGDASWSQIQTPPSPFPIILSGFPDWSRYLFNTREWREVLHQSTLHTDQAKTRTQASKSEAHALTIRLPCLSLFLLQASRTAGLRDTYATAGLVTARLIVTLRSLSQSSRQLSPSQIWGEHAYCGLRAYNSVQLCGTVKGQYSSLLAFKW